MTIDTSKYNGKFKNKKISTYVLNDRLPVRVYYQTTADGGRMSGGRNHQEMWTKYFERFV